MPKTKLIESALHDWVHALTFQQQALLMTGMRGPDGCEKHCAAKVIIRFMRGAICKPAGNWDGGNNNDFMWGDYGVFKTWQRKFFDDPDGYPHHFIMHLVHCAEVIGYKHPDDSIAHFWRSFYEKACHSFHMYGETEEEMDRRLNDFGVEIAESSPVTSTQEEKEADSMDIKPLVSSVIAWIVKTCHIDEGRIYYQCFKSDRDNLISEFDALALYMGAPIPDATPKVDRKKESLEKILRWIFKNAPPEFREEKPFSLKGFRHKQSGNLISYGEVANLFLLQSQNK